jgi:hypothetical protein
MKKIISIVIIQLFIKINILKMKKIIIAFMLSSAFCINANAQKGRSNSGVETSGKCNCSKLDVYPYMYLQNPRSATSNYILHFDFNHKGQKCTPEFINSIIISASGRSITIPVGRLTTHANTINTRQFLISREQIGFTILPERACSITYSLTYGITGVCPASVQKIIKVSSEGPIL